MEINLLACEANSLEPFRQPRLAAVIVWRNRLDFYQVSGKVNGG
jgi:hypothetical protein